MAQMMAHELLRQAALILGASWSKGADARDATGRIVPLLTGNARATINPAAVAFSPYGAICKAASQDHAPQLTRLRQAALIPAGHSKGADSLNSASRGRHIVLRAHIVVDWHRDPHR
jgi:hypothetical protein